MRLAAVTHDIERMFPGGTGVQQERRAAGMTFTTCTRTRPARRRTSCTGWQEQGDAAGYGVSVSEGRPAGHARTAEFGGLERCRRCAERVSSLSFLESPAGHCHHLGVSAGSATSARPARSTWYMADRIRLAEARRLAEPLLAEAMAALDEAVRRGDNRTGLNGTEVR